MRRTLYRKLILIYVILAIAGFTLISTVGSRMVEDSLVSSASTSLYREATQIASKQGDLYYHSERSLTDLYNSLSALASYHNSQIWLISADGEILLNTAAALDEENPEIIDGFDPVALGSEYYSTGTFFGYFEDKMLSVMVPVTSDFRINGYVAIHLPLQDVYQQRESLLARIDFLFLLVFGLSFVILIFFSLVVYRPLKKIINGAKEYASGNLTHKIDVKSHDEMGYLASTLNYMSGELNKTGEYQRKFVANVSHDFRSPLTSIKGYVEAILDGTIPPEMQEKYLKIVLFETERLHKLTQSLLTLNDIDDKGNMLDLTSFDINAVIKEDNKVLGLPEDDGLLTHSGEQLMTGKQAQAYARYRYGTSDGDFGRTARQREVITKIFHRLTEMSMVELSALAMANIGNVVTNLTLQDIMLLAPAMLSLKDAEIEELRLPVDGGYKFQTVRGMSVIVPDRTKTMEAIASFLTEEEG